MKTQRRGIGQRASALGGNEFRMFPELLPTYEGLTLFLSDIHGHVGGGIEGLYHHKTRFLSRLAFTVDGRAPGFVSANAVTTHAATAYYLAPAPASADARIAGEVREKAIEVQVDRFVGRGLHQCATLTNHTLYPFEVVIAWEVDADMSDLCAPDPRCQPFADARFERRWSAASAGGTLEIRAEHEGIAHAARLAFSGPAAYEDGRVVQRVALPPKTPVALCLDVSPVFLGEVLTPRHGCGAFEAAGSPAGWAREAYMQGCARLTTHETLVQPAWERAVADLATLPLYEGEGAQIYTPAAGIPIYQALYGRDVLTTGWHSAILNPVMLRGALETIASKLGRRYDDRFDEQPGRVMHQHQLSPTALLGLTPYIGYYGDYAGPGLFAMAAAAYYRTTGDLAFMRQLREPLLRVLEWMDRDGDRDGDGFYEYDTRAGAWGTKNQGWKDSPEAFVYDDGTFAPNPLAACEIQGYYYAAKRELAQVFRALGDDALARALGEQAEDLKRRFNSVFWLPEEGFYALALDPEKRPLRSIASNVGHLLACGIVNADKAAAVAERLMAPDMFSGWGIRTLSSAHPAYNPFSYHLGSVWPSENGTIALGLKRYGFDAAVQSLARGLFDASRCFDGRRLPEAIGGHPRDARHPHPGIYPRSCAPQAWSASAVVAVVQALLGLVPDAPNGTLHVAPALPDWLPEVVVENLPVGRARVSLHFWREATGETGHDVLVSGGVTVARAGRDAAA